MTLSVAGSSPSAVHLTNAVFCCDCENISLSPHEICAICGSKSLVSLFQILGGTLRSYKAQIPPVNVRYNLHLEVKAYDVPSQELNRAIRAITELLECGSDVECANFRIDSVIVPAQRHGIKAA